VQPEIFENRLDVGKLVAARRGSGQDLLALRDYQPQDDLRHVDWKATARARRLIVREFAAEDDKRVTIAFDTRIRRAENANAKDAKALSESEKRDKALSDTQKRFESAVSQIASLLLFYAEDQTETRLVIDHEIGEFGIGRKHLNENLKRLAFIEPTVFDAKEIEFLFEDFQTLFDSLSNSYFYLVVSASEVLIPSALADNVRVINY
jgi:uncharacterized protein (DUF58 family)